MRLFFGVRPPMKLRQRIADTIHSHVKNTGRPYRGVPASFLHITTHFVGDVTEKSQVEIKRSFQKSRMPYQSEITLGSHGTGMFGKDVLYLPVEDPAQLLHSLKKEGQRIAPVRESHPVYTPHCTVVRNPKGEEWDPLLETLKVRPVDFSFTPREVLLIHSYERKGKKFHDIIARRRLPRGKKRL